LQQKMENMCLMIWKGNTANYSVLLKKGKHWKQADSFSAHCSIHLLALILLWASSICFWKSWNVICVISRIYYCQHASD
jgi:hypothetical protein